MSRKIEAILAEVIEEMFMQMAFVFPDDFASEDMEQADDDNMSEAHVHYYGPFSGVVIMKVTDAVIEEMASNMLDLDPGDADKSQINDAFREMLNVVCGNLLPKVGGNDPVFNIDPPQIGAVPKTNWSREASTQVALEKGVCRLTLATMEDVDLPLL